ncbi:hypothetical protein QQG55_44525 [Brugia pahangi]|uniref:Transmembrane protein n=1 Tax=Brugia pahangi TaxID=6280 RepID=A0A0N4SXZ7_BRUPA|nr:unnamed protein product [Brugia pahangi]
MEFKGKLEGFRFSGLMLLLFASLYTVFCCITVPKDEVKSTFSCLDLRQRLGRKVQELKGQLFCCQYP